MVFFEDKFVRMDRLPNNYWTVTWKPRLGIRDNQIEHDGTYDRMTETHATIGHALHSMVNKYTSEAENLNAIQGRLDAIHDTIKEVQNLVRFL